MKFPPAYLSISDINAYQTGKPISELAREIGIEEEAIVKLASNENPLGCSPKALTAMQNELSNASRYPDGAGFYLKQAIIQHHDNDLSIDTIAIENIVLGNGSNDVLDLITRTFVSADDTTVFSQYAFAVYWLATKSVGATPIIVPAQEYGHDLSAMAKAITTNTKVVFLANPNNPTGTYFEYEALLSFLQAVPKHVLVVLDEAYVEYFEPDEYRDTVPLLVDFPNLIITRTFSKAYGLASLRVGYALCHTDISDMMNRIRQPFNVNSFAQASAIASLEDTDFVNESRMLNSAQKKYLYQELDELKIQYIPSKTNFIAIKVGDTENTGSEMYEKLLEKGVITRPLAGYGMGEWLRVSIGLEAENQRFIDVFRAIINLRCC